MEWEGPALEPAPLFIGEVRRRSTRRNVANQKVTVEAEALAALMESYVFGVLTQEPLARLAKLARFERFDEPTTLCSIGGTLDALRYVRSGAIRPVRVSSGGGAVSLVPMVAGIWATWPGAFCADPLPHDLVADAGTTCLRFPKRAVVELAAAYPVLYPRVIDELSRTVRGLMALIMTTSEAKDERSLARGLLAVCLAFGEGRKRGVTLEMTQEQIGKLGFGSRQRVAVMLKKLSEAGVVDARYGRLIVKDVGRLEAWLDEDAGG